MRESLGALAKPGGAVKAGSGPFADRRWEDAARREPFRAAALPGRLGLGRRRTPSAHVGTRKMVNYAWSGRSQGKP